MSKHNRMSDAQREAIADLRGERGWTIDRIAEHLGLSPGSVSYRCLIDGIEKPGPVTMPPACVGPMVVMRGAYPVRRFSAAEDAQLLALEAQGLSPSEIGRRMRRRPNSVNARLATLARRDERRENAA